MWPQSLAVENTLGIRKRHMRYSNRKCTYRRELNSHEAAKSELPSGTWLGDTGTTGRASKANSLIRVRAGVSAGQSKHTTTQPEAARLGQQRASGKSLGPRINAGQNYSNQRSWAPATNQGREHKTVVRLQGAQRHAISRRWPQTRSTATALAVALSGKQNLAHMKSSLAASRAN